MCTENQLRNQAKYRAKKEQKSQINGVFLKVDNVPIIGRKKENDGLKIEIRQEKGYEYNINGEKIYIQGNHREGYKINLYGMVASENMNTLSEAKEYAKNQIPDFIKRNSSGVSTAKKKYEALMKNNGRMSFKEYRNIG